MVNVSPVTDARPDISADARPDISADTDTDTDAGADAGVERLFGSVVAFGRRLHATGQRWADSGTGLTRGEVGLMRVVAEGECRSGAVAARLGVGPAVVSRQLAHLDDIGMVARKPDPADGRAELLSLTGRGAHALRDLRAAHLGRLRERLADWDDDRLAAATDVVDTLTEALAPPPGEQEPRHARTQRRTKDTA